MGYSSMIIYSGEVYIEADSPECSGYFPPEDVEIICAGNVEVTTQ
jgi:hypothetical protein